MRNWRVTIGGAFAGLALLAALVACGSTSQATAVPLVPASATPTTGPTATATAARSGPPGSPIIPLPIDGTPGAGRPSGSPQLPFPSGTPPFGGGSPVIPRPSGSPQLPIPSGPPSTAPSAGAVTPTSDGGCPASHPIKAAMLGPLKSYFTADDAQYSRTRASECFANTTDAEAAGYRKAGR